MSEKASYTERGMEAISSLAHLQYGEQLVAAGKLKKARRHYGELLAMPEHADNPLIRIASADVWRLAIVKTGRLRATSELRRTTINHHFLMAQQDLEMLADDRRRVPTLDETLQPHPQKTLAQNALTYLTSRAWGFLYLAHAVTLPDRTEIRVSLSGALQNMMHAEAALAAGIREELPIELPKGLLPPDPDDTAAYDDFLIDMLVPRMERRQDRRRADRALTASVAYTEERLNQCASDLDFRAKNWHKPPNLSEPGPLVSDFAHLLLALEGTDQPQDVVKHDVEPTHLP